jgi:murein DD-endopeptidase MepM/ murein hydrolase activator NlpD
MWSRRISRRIALGGVAAIALAGGHRASAQTTRQELSYPIRTEDGLPGDSFIIRHGFACENTWYNPGFWHTAEDWYALEGDTAGATVVAIGDGTIVSAGGDYPGRVVIVQHGDALFSVYGHLDDDVAVSEGDGVTRGDVLGTVLLRTDGNAPSHLHFEVRTFLLTDEVNGDSPRYGFACGYECPPGPGYWPIDAPEHPSSMGWRNPLETIAASMSIAEDERRVAVAAVGAKSPAQLWSLPSDHDDALLLGEFSLDAGETFRLFEAVTRDPASTQTSAEAYRLWYSIALPDGTRGWIQAAIPDSGDTGSDGRPSSVRLQLLPQVGD